MRAELSCETSNMRLKEVSNTPGNRKLFRQIARDTSGETFEPPAEEKIILCYLTDVRGCEKLVGVGSYRLADKLQDEPTADFSCTYYHMLSYLFVTAYNQGGGCGNGMLRRAMVSMLQHVRRPIRVESAQGAVGFFTKLGFKKAKSEPIVCAFSGSAIFSRLYQMELVPKIPGSCMANRSKLSLSGKTALQQS